MVPAVFKYIWSAPCSAVGICVGAVLVCAGASASANTGVIEVSFRNRSQRVARWLSKLPVAAITLGHVVIAITQEEQNRLRAHERAHVAQYEKWGLLFFVLYPASSLLQILAGRHFYQDNHFEVQARNAERALRR